MEMANSEITNDIRNQHSYQPYLCLGPFALKIGHDEP